MYRGGIVTAFKKWEIGTADKEAAKMLAEDVGADPFAAMIAVSRGICDPLEFELMLSNEPVLCEPRELADIGAAAEFLNAAVSENKKICVFGDYDCDGVTATAIMTDYLESRGADAVPYIPDRIDEGYGMSKEAVEKLSHDGINIIVTVDNGISCAEEIEYAKTLGIDVVVTDHHLPPEKLPEAVAVVDPHRADCRSAFKEVCGAQVAFKLICVMDDKEPEQMLYRYADLLTVALIGDVMPLINENRSIVKCGLGMMKSRPRTGISALINSAGIERESLNAGKISFGIVPRINTAGRMGSATRALELLKSDDMMSALRIAGELEKENALRQKTEKDIMDEAVLKIEQNKYQYNRVIVVDGVGWHMGVVGIVASRICEKYAKPAIVLSVDGDMAHGSGRSYDGFALFDAINACRDTLEKYGGHALAAGVSVKRERIDEFRKRINEYALKLPYIPPTLKLDLKINPAAMSIDMAYSVKTLEPFGFGNPAPQFALLGVTLERITELSGGKHLKLMFRKGETSFQALLFSVSLDKFCFNVGDLCDVAVMFDINYFKNNYTLSILVKAIKLSSDYPADLFDRISAYDDFISGYAVNSELLLPSREEIAAVYRATMGAPVSEKRLEYIFIENPGYAKTKTALKILEELGLIVFDGEKYTQKKVNEKTDLMNSSVYRLLKGGDSVDR